MGKLTAKTVQSLIKEGKPNRYSDGDGLNLILPRKGSAYWALRYTLRGKRQEFTLGKEKHLSLSEARSKAEDARRMVRSGNNPIVERKRESDVTIRTLDELFSDWHQERCRWLKHPEIPKRIYCKDISLKLGLYPLATITPLEIRAVLRSIIDRPSIANDALMYLKQLFNHGIKLGLLSNNPAAALKVTDAGGIEKSRDRALSLEELHKAFQIFREQSDQFTRDNYLACALLLLLGVRKSELIEATWAEFDLERSTWELPAGRSKTGIGFTIPLPRLALTWLEELQVRACGSDHVFPNRRSSKRQHMGKDTLNRAIAKLFGREKAKNGMSENRMGDLEYFTVHDLRRTCRSLLAAAGVSGDVAERCLNHKLKGSEAIYNRHDYLEERRDALEKLAAMVTPLL
ncbi:tyrosine-type recombinase/integrase [Gallaecimonas kandeliae]|uniref:tyrosine-type recombinase/integrase n=1 Tax=Gallaecimonas kandeliae TaxID=3029055 RepID=UPI002649076B|nr:site-specific integrase [Gallaecimonas kandeliae]WKE65794.1 tyrosine-type recombinase/integrase [Gallaecimonas kandeliae]